MEEVKKALSIKTDELLIVNKELSSQFKRSLGISREAMSLRFKIRF